MKDIQLEDDNNLKISDGDFVIFDCEEQNIYNILQAYKNDYKETQNLGVGINSELNTTNTRGLNNLIKQNLIIDKILDVDVKIDYDIITELFDVKITKK